MTAAPAASPTPAATALIRRRLVAVWLVTAVGFGALLAPWYAVLLASLGGYLVAVDRTAQP